MGGWVGGWVFVGGVTRATTLHLFCASFQAVDARNSCLHHGKTVGCWSNVTGSRFLPRVIGHHEEHEVESEGVPYVHSGDKVPYMRGVKGSTKETNS